MRKRMDDFYSAYEPQLDDIGVAYRLDPTEGQCGYEEPAERDGCKGLSRQDKPFQPWLTLSDPAGMAAGLGLPLCANALVDDAICALVAGLIALEQMGHAEWLFYSRDDHHYVGLGRNVPRFYRRKVVIEAVDRLADAGLVEHCKTNPSPRARYRSRIRATPALRARIGTLPAAATRLGASHAIVLRGADGRPHLYKETKSTSALRQDVETHNTFLKAFEVTVSHSEAGYDAQGYLVIGGHRLNPLRTSYRRIFNSSFARGGRWYGPWWQSVPSRIRGGICINGEPTCEPDIRGCHMRLLCARAGVALRDGDPYAGLGLPRNHVKLAINVMLNARNWRSARGALIERLSDCYGPTPGSHVDQIRAAVRTRFPALEPHWNTGFGLVPQNIDAGICASVQRRLRDQDIPCLSVHDRFIVPQSARDLTVAAMDEEFDRACRLLRARR
jgi:hypothetical protein